MNIYKILIYILIVLLIVAYIIYITYETRDNYVNRRTIEKDGYVVITNATNKNILEYLPKIMYLLIINTRLGDVLYRHFIEM